MSIRKVFAVALVLIASISAAGAQTKVAAGAKVFIAPMEGNLHGFIAPEILKKKVPLVIVTEERMRSTS